MSLRTHSVVVHPDQWSGPTEELARLLAPVAGTAADALAPVLRRGPMTVEADLSAEDARSLRGRLATLGIPASIVADGDDLDSDDEGGAWAGVPGIAATSERERITDEVDRGGRRNTMMGLPNQSGGGWGALFPDLEAGSEASEAEPAAEPLTPADEPDANAPPKALPPSLDELDSGPVTLPKQPAPAPEPRPSPPNRPAVPTKPATSPEPTNSAANAPTTDRSIPSRDFDASKLRPLMPQPASERPPYAPDGFDNRVEHHPPFAFAFGVAAPGAGQVFNGDDEEGLSYGLRFFLIKPWYDSAKKAKEKAEKIRTYYAPRPAEGNVIRAFRYVVAWWICVVLSAVLLTWGGQKLYEIATREPVPDGPTAEQIAGVFADARTGVLSARIAALDALQEASKDLVPDAQYSMSKEERAKRLFAIAYEECSRSNYGMCENMMGRVNEIVPGFPGALRMQAWASLVRRGGKAEMPEMKDAPKLDEIELDLYRQQMREEGERIPQAVGQDNDEPEVEVVVPNDERGTKR